MKRIVIYDASDDTSVEKFVKFVQDLPADKKWRFEVEDVKPIRSLSQNRRYWGIINQVATETGHTQEEIDYLFRMECHYETFTFPNGVVEKVPAKTSNRDTREYTAILNKLERWVIEHFPEIQLTRGDEMTLEKWMEIDNNYQRSQSGF